jgi:hypothetical protein
MKQCFNCGGPTIESGNIFIDGTKELLCPRCAIYVPDKIPEAMAQTIQFLTELLKNSRGDAFTICQ